LLRGLRYAERFVALLLLLLLLVVQPLPGAVTKLQTPGQINKLINYL
jgi:hypothetical protein